MDYKNNFNKQFEQSLIALENMLNATPKYQRKPCKNCKYKMICAGECEKTLKGGE